jgi:hypothetical protein
MHRRQRRLAGLSTVGAFSAPAASARRPPNIIFVLADDLGLSRLSCYGADTFQTPQFGGRTPVDE